MLCGSTAKPQASDSPRPWTTFVTNEKGEQEREAKPCQKLAELVRAPLDLTDLGWPTPPRAGALKVKVHLVGTVRARRIYDVHFRQTSADGSSGEQKLIAVERNPGVFCPIYISTGGGSQTSFTLSRIVRRGERPMLETRSRIDGTGYFFDEQYWTLGPSGPVRIVTHAVINDALGRVLPAGRGVWKGSGLNMKSGCFAHFVWDDQDANCCPTGGMVLLRLSMRGNQLAVTHSAYDPRPTDDALAERWRRQCPWPDKLASAWGETR